MCTIARGLNYEVDLNLHRETYLRESNCSVPKRSIAKCAPWLWHCLYEKNSSPHPLESAVAEELHESWLKHSSDIDSELNDVPVRSLSTMLPKVSFLLCNGLLCTWADIGGGGGWRRLGQGWATGDGWAGGDGALYPTEKRTDWKFRTRMCGEYP